MTKLEVLCNEYRENKRMIEELTALNDSIKDDIITIMGDNDTVIQGTAKITYKTVSSTKFDSTSFKKEYSDLYNKYSNTTQYKRFIVQ